MSGYLYSFVFRVFKIHMWQSTQKQCYLDVCVWDMITLWGQRP